MYIRESVTRKAPFEPCRDALLASEQGDRLDRIGFSVLSKRVAMHFGEPSGGRDWLLIPLGWEARPAHDAFPVFDGQLTLARTDTGSVKLQLTGTYEPPLGRVGAAADSMLMRQAARATVRSLLRELADQLVKDAAAPAV